MLRIHLFNQKFSIEIHEIDKVLLESWDLNNRNVQFSGLGDNNVVQIPTVLTIDPYCESP